MNPATEARTPALRDPPVPDHCDECGRAVSRDINAHDGYGYAPDGSLLCYPCLDAARHDIHPRPSWGERGPQTAEEYDA